MGGVNQASGVDYNTLDESKLVSSRYARATDNNLTKRFGQEMLPFIPSRGESVFLVREHARYLAVVIEGLGTENLAADAYQRESPVPGSRYDVIGYNCVASIVNDLITAGAYPAVVEQYLAVGDEEFLKDIALEEALARGFKEACDDAACVWGGGETPALKGIIVPGTVDLAGCAVGYTPGLNPWWHGRVQAGDAIVCLESRGMHMNGFTAVRQHMSALAGSQGYCTRVAGTDQTIGDLLLARAHIYVDAVEFALKEGFEVHYGAHISGHGWRKLARAPQPFTYRIHTMPTMQPLFPFLQEMLGYDDEEMYSSYIMNIGFALFMPEREAGRFVRLGNKQGWPYRAFIAGRVETGPKRVIIEPLGNLELPGDSMQIR